MPYFAESTTFSRLILALLGILAVVVITVAIKDYVVQRRDVTATVSTTPPVAPSSDAEKRNASSKKRRARANTAGSNAAATAQADAEGLKEQGSDEFATATVINNAPNPASTQTPHNETNTRLRTASDSDGPELFAARCVPLPNLTKPGDVDGPYYQNWAKEYCGK